jgi:hypothetical protein
MVSMTETYYIIAKFTSDSKIHKCDAEHFAQQMLTELGTDITVHLMEVEELTN